MSGERLIEGRGRRWRVAPPHPGAAELADALRVDPLIGQLLAGRGVESPDAARRFFQPRLSDLHDPRLLPGCERAADRIVHALREGETIVIYGDYDVDGVTATAILYHTLTAAAPDATIQRYIPHRIDEGYGVNAEALGKVIDHGAKLIVTVDCGVTAVEPAKLAAERGVDLVITDHHALPSELPECHTIVHPRLHERLDDLAAYPFGELCGAGVAYKLAWQVARAWCGTERVSDVFKQLMVNLLPLAALGTVADVVPLVDENRAITRFGLGNIKHTPIEGLNALIDASRLRDEKIDAYHVGFILGPRLNACGRMGHAIEACKLLTTATGAEARQIAETLNRANDDRRQTEQAIVKQASDLVVERGYDRDDVRAIVLDDQTWHPGVIGIVSSRLTERFARPVVLISTANGVAQGSGRSIEGFDLHAALTACGEHLASYGGHAMAAGLKIERDRIGAFREALVAHAATKLEPADLVPMMDLDAAVQLDHVRASTMHQLDNLRPFGRANPAPTLLVEGATLAQPPQVVGAGGAHLVLFLQQGRTTTRCIAWRLGEQAEHFPAGRVIDAAVRPKLNVWNGVERVEYQILDAALR